MSGAGIYEVRSAELANSAKPLHRWRIEDRLLEAGYEHVAVDRVSDDLAWFQPPRSQAVGLAPPGQVRQAPLRHESLVLR